MTIPILAKCPFCEESIDAPYRGVAELYGYQANCPCCGTYVIDSGAIPLISNSGLTNRQRANISGYLKENQVFWIKADNVDNLLTIQTPSFHERADKLILALEKKTEYAGHFLEINKSWLSFGWCLNDAELTEMLTFLEETGRIAHSYPNSNVEGYYKIIPDGWAYLEELKKVNPDSQQGFVAMWFDDKMMEIYGKAISEGILDAGYQPHLVKDREHNDRIDDEIIAQIRRSRFVLADFTGHRGGVYYEAGFAQGLGIEVFWTCRKDDIDNLHFDIRQYNCIDWSPEQLPEFRKRIALRIESVIGQGTYRREEL